MPTVNIYSKNNKGESIQTLISDLKKYLAEKLTCGEIQLKPEEISIRFINVAGGEMIGDIEVEIKAHSFPERVKKEDEISKEIMNYLKDKIPALGEVKVWLQLSELGHSW